jgi:hypothetical protein
MMSVKGLSPCPPWMHAAKSCPHDVDPWKLTVATT